MSTSTDTPGPTSPDPAPPAPTSSVRVDDAFRTPQQERQRTTGLGTGLTWLATWSLRLILIAAGGYLLVQVLGLLWTVVLPVLLALLLASVLWPLTARLRKVVPAALAATIVLLGFFVVLVGGLALLAPSVTEQAADIADQAAGGLRELQGWVTGPPLNLDDGQVDAAVAAVTDRLQASAATLAAGVLTGVTAVTNLLITAALVLVLTFFFLKDGPRFLPWVNGIVGARAATHVDVVLARSWSTLGSFIQGQALVGLVDAVLIGIGLVLCGVPLALPLAVLTFFGGFVPIIGAFVVGALAVLVALVTKGTTIALIVLAIIFAVQQLEGNVLQPVLQGKSLRLHPAVVILAVAAGSALYGIAGAFLSVPLAAVAAVVLRYTSEVLDGRSGTDADSSTDAEADADVQVDDLPERAHRA